MDIKKEMLRIRKRYYDSDRDLAATLNGYIGLLEKAKTDSDVAYEDLSLCLSSIAMVLHESNRLPEAILAYDALLTRNMQFEMRARVYQNKGAALLANHQYGEAIRATLEALKFAKLANDADLVGKLEHNLLEIRRIGNNPPEKITVVGVKEPLETKKLENLLSSF